MPTERQGPTPGRPREERIRSVSGSDGKRLDRKREISLLTGGGDRHYALGLATVLMSKGVFLEIIGSPDLDTPDFHDNEKVYFLDLVGPQRPEANFFTKLARVLKYYLRLIRYITTSQPPILHILWNYKFQLLDRTLLMVYYKLLGKKLVLTVHNVNEGKRDSNDSLLNRLSLGFQYRLTDHFFVHTALMKTELTTEFGVCPTRVSVIPYGINNAVPETELTCVGARRQLQIGPGERAILFFGNIAPYKGLEYLL